MAAWLLLFRMFCTGLVFFFRTSGLEWKSTNLSIIDAMPGDLPMPLSALVDNYNPFVHFQPAATKAGGISADRESLTSAMIMGCEVLKVLPGQTSTYRSCANPLCEGLARFEGATKACPHCPR